MTKGVVAAIALAVLTVSGVAVPTTASADQIECASDKGRRQECSMDTRGEVRLVRQLSKAACVEGQSYGISKHGVWVQNGCRAVFASEGGGGGGGYAGAQNYGGGYGGGHAGTQNYGGGSGGGAPAVVTCESSGGQRAECEMDTRGEVRLQRQHSKAGCVEGQTYGISKHGVWVSGGCRATFENVSRANEGGRGYGQGGGGYDAPTPRQVEACRQRAGGYADVVSQEALRPGSWSLVLRNRDGEFACDVDPNGRVDGFQQISR
jgi:hypothetical protein